jgi:hypothetical protein
LFGETIAEWGGKKSDLHKEKDPPEVDPRSRKTPASSAKVDGLLPGRLLFVYGKNASAKAMVEMSGLILPLTKRPLDAASISLGMDEHRE